jgi:hypothetical protein
VDALLTIVVYIKYDQTNSYTGLQRKHTIELNAMSLLQACNRATAPSRRLLVGGSTVLSRALATDLSPETSKKDVDIVTPTQLPQDVMVADAISGAPGCFLSLFQRCFVNIFAQASFVTVRCGFINQRETPCKVVGVKASAGG